MVYAIAWLNGVKTIGQPNDNIMDAKNFTFTVGGYSYPIIAVFIVTLIFAPAAVTTIFKFARFKA
ncbi:hypothetical protein MUTS10_09980 [Escherichia coli]|nr:hypothetical protein MUTS9_10750 [Escherichia coli]BDY77666.1 hypothetical protein MUTS10_09980 [Escherichia coli]BDY82688.1 hypothetical protein MUTS11_10040 [Escherichia coli]